MKMNNDSYNEHMYVGNGLWQEAFKDYVARQEEIIEPGCSNDVEMLAYMGTDSEKWAQEFNRTTVKQGGPDLDEGYLIGWFANAIEHSWQVRSRELEAQLDKVEQAKGYIDLRIESYRLKYEETRDEHLRAYFKGHLNGLIYAKANLEGRDPIFVPIRDSSIDSKRFG
jgi:hypothetical protein